MLLYYPLNREWVNDTDYRSFVYLNDYSGMGHSSVFYDHRNKGKTDPSFATMPDTLSLAIWNDVSECHMVKYDK
jgi:hypothetical protein